MVNKKYLILLAAVALLCLLCGFFVAKGMYDQPIVESVTRDTVTITDTVVQYAPKPVSVEKVRTEYKWLPVVRTDTVTQYFGISEQLPEHPQDSALVEIPITSKHYHGENYDAYVSGFETNLDSIFVYNETQLITETITRMKPPNKWSLSVNAGVDYGTTSKFWMPYASGELTINNDKRLQLGIEGGVKKNEVTNNFEPFAGAKLKLKIF